MPRLHSLLHVLLEAMCLKHWQPFTRLHSVTSQRTAISLFTVASTATETSVLA
jgi:hypothetical protein